MTKTDYARSKGITVEALQAEMMAFLETEGYDDAGNEYQTLDAWLARKPLKQTYEPYDGGRGIGDYGNG